MLLFFLYHVNSNEDRPLKLLLLVKSVTRIKWNRLRDLTKVLLWTKGLCTCCALQPHKNSSGFCWASLFQKNQISFCDGFNFSYLLAIMLLKKRLKFKINICIKLIICPFVSWKKKLLFPRSRWRRRCLATQSSPSPRRPLRTFGDFF